jgi:hypothetical protein
LARLSRGLLYIRLLGLMVDRRTDPLNFSLGPVLPSSPQSDYWFRIVPDRRSRILEVVIVRRLLTWVLGIGVGREWERVEKGEVSLQAT